jgi:hypothetical protein
MSTQEFENVTRRPTIDRRGVLRAGSALAGATALLNTSVGGVPARLAQAAEANAGSIDMVYQLEGRILEVCTCQILCPCWVGENPDFGTCDSVIAWHVDRGTIDGLDVSGRTIALINHIPGNVLAGNWTVVFFVDAETTPEQQEALLSVWTGQKGGPVADLAQLYGEVTATQRVPITFLVEGGQGTLRIGSEASPVVVAELSPFQGATGKSTTLVDTVFSTIPGAPAYVGKAARFQRVSSQLGLKDIDLSGHNAIQGSFSFTA